MPDRTKKKTVSARAPKAPAKKARGAEKAKPKAKRAPKRAPGEKRGPKRKATGKPTPKGRRTPPEEIEYRIGVVEQMMVQRYRTNEIAAYGAAHWGTSYQAIIHYMADVRARWEAERPIERERIKDSLRASLDEAHKVALTRTMPLKDGDGNPVLDRNGDPVMVPIPDPKTAISATKTLLQLEGVAQKTEVQVSGGVEVAHGIEKGSREMLESWLGGPKKS
jgi:hypothetical protein